jgi:ferric-dicitrate binding protein FerR (iron transport regulator)
VIFQGAAELGIPGTCDLLRSLSSNRKSRWSAGQRFEGSWLDDSRRRSPEVRAWRHGFIEMEEVPLAGVIGVT